MFCVRSKTQPGRYIVGREGGGVEFVGHSCWLTNPTDAASITLSSLRAWGQGGAVGGCDLFNGSGGRRHLAVCSSAGIVRWDEGAGSQATVLSVSPNVNQAWMLSNGTYVWAMIGNLGLYRSQDYGDTWQLIWSLPLSDKMETDWTNVIRQEPGNPNTLWISTAGGLYRWPSAHTAARAGSPYTAAPTGATRITGGSFGTGVRPGVFCFDQVTSDLWVVGEVDGDSQIGSLHRGALASLSGSSLPFVDVTDEIIAECVNMAQDIDMRGGRGVLSTVGMGMLVLS